jgi:hypothetical protein
MPLLDQKTLQEFISTKNLYPKIEDIGKKYHLELGQMGYLSSEIRNAITGVIRPSNLIPRIVDQLEISPAQAEEIARDVNASIFSLIADHMQEINKGAKITVAPLEVKNITPTTPSDAFFPPTSPTSLIPTSSKRRVNFLSFAIWLYLSSIHREIKKPHMRL